jgi:sulfur-oxidizing protein SoxX
MHRLAFLILAAAIAHPAFGQQATDLFTRPDKGYCIACHQLPAGAGPEVRNDVGPRLEGSRMRSLGKDRLRQIIDDASKANPDSIMPPFGRHRILDAREIASLAEFLHALP